MLPLLLAVLPAWSALAAVQTVRSPEGGVASSQAAGAGLRLFVPFHAGGEADASARNFQKSVTRSTGRRMEIVNLTAESGGAAGRAVQQAAPDGNTLLLARVRNLSVLPLLVPQAAPAAADLTVLAVLDQAPLICFVRSAAPIESLRDLQAALAAQPGQLRYSTGGAHSLQAIAVRYLLLLSSLPQDAARAVPVSEGALVTQAVLTGEADFACNTPQQRAAAGRGRPAAAAADHGPGTAEGAAAPAERGRTGVA
ncbi:MAG: tripartite tricarboxylate transporter substrate-binding protein [Roseateles sp.]